MQYQKKIATLTAAGILAVAFILTPATVGSAFAAIIYTADNQSVTTTFETAKDITLTGSGPEFAILTNPTNGALSNFNATTGFVTYTPNAGYEGADSFTFKTTDGTDDSNPATVDITVGPEPLTNSLAYTTPYLTSVDVQLEVVNGATFVITVQPTHGTITTFDNVAGTLTYNPTVHFYGQDSFTFVTTDGVNTSAASTITIDVERPRSGGTAKHILANLAAGEIKALEEIPESTSGLSLYDATIGAPGFNLKSAMRAVTAAGMDWNSLTEGQQVWLMENFNEFLN